MIRIWRTSHWQEIGSIGTDPVDTQPAFLDNDDTSILLDPHYLTYWSLRDRLIAVRWPISGGNVTVSQDRASLAL